MYIYISFLCVYENYIVKIKGIFKFTVIYINVYEINFFIFYEKLVLLPPKVVTSAAEREKKRGSGSSMHMHVSFTTMVVNESTFQVVFLSIRLVFQA